MVSRIVLWTSLALGLALLGQPGPASGTQPNTLAPPPEGSASCGCHLSYDFERVVEPGQSYRATAMALAARDPLFRAAFVAARRERPELTESCVRCHAPLAWLQGRSTGALDALEPEPDLDGVGCDVCHRMVASEPPLVGNGQYVLAQGAGKRGARGIASEYHPVARDAFVGASELCAACHSLFNPAERGHDAAGRELGQPHFEQRTYEEWRDSAFSMRAEDCADCHMSRARGAARRGGEEREDLAVHDMVGGNAFVGLAVRLLGHGAIAAELPEVERWVDRSLASAATLEVISPRPAVLTARSGEALALGVRLTNRTGHKLPSGYPEGRRVYLEVTLALPGQAPMRLSGAWDPATGDLIADPQLRTYETVQGRFEAGRSARSRSLVTMNQVLLDTRLPPEGFVPAAEDMRPVGRDYGAGPLYRHWDEHEYRWVAPDVERTVTGTVTVRAMYQVTDGEVVRHLLEGAAGSPEADALAEVWEALERAPPRALTSVSVPMTISPRPAEPGDQAEHAGCNCTDPRRAPRSWELLAALGLAWIAVRAREVRR